MKVILFGATGMVGQGVLRARQPPADRPGFARVGHADQVMGDGRALGRRRRGGQHRQVGVDLHGVGADDLGAHGFAEP